MNTVAKGFAFWPLRASETPSGAGLEVGLGAELLTAAVIALGFVAFLVLVELWHQRSGPPVETTRKLVHVVSGLPVLVLPWLFQSVWTVVGLLAFVAALFALTRRRGLLESVHDVERRSRGDLLYPLGIVLLFTLGHERPVLYFVSVLVLILSDPAAALIGLAYGRTRYEVEEHWRSMEGSLAFFLMTFLAVHLPLLLMTELDPAVTVLVGLVVGIAVTLFEAISLDGADNLAVPLATYLFLERLTPESPATLGVHAGVLLTLMVVLTLLARRFDFLKESGVMAATLFFYLVFALAGPAWLVPPAVGTLALILFRATLRHAISRHDAEYQVVAIAYATLPTLALVVGLRLPELGAAWGGGRPEAFAAVLSGAVAGQLGIMFATQFHPFNPSQPRGLPLVRLMALLLGAWALIVPASLGAAGALDLGGAALAAAVALISGLTYWLGRSATTWPSAAPWNFRLQAATVTGVSLLAVGFFPALGG